MHLTILKDVNDILLTEMNSCLEKSLCVCVCLCIHIDNILEGQTTKY